MHDFVAYRLKIRGISELLPTEPLEGFMAKMRKKAQEIDDCKDNKEKNILKDQLKAMARIAVENDPHIACLWAEAHLHKDVTNALRDAWKEQITHLPNDVKLLSDFDLVPSICDVRRLPFLSFMISFPFSLEKPYISKDDEVFYLLDNSVRKEKLFRNPMVASTAWKGAMRHAFWHIQQSQGEPVIEDDVILRLFGTDNASQTNDFTSGRLHFFSSFFEKASMELINPHDRKSGTTASGPILMEAVTKGQQSTFTLLYCFTSVTSDQSEEQSIMAVVKDIETICQGITAMMTVYGFGAKTSSGFGIARYILPEPGGRLAIRTREIEKGENSESSVKVLNFRSYEEMNNLASEIENVLSAGGDDGSQE